MVKICKCGKSFNAYNTIQKDCGVCQVAKNRDRAAEKRKHGKKEGLKGKEDDTKGNIRNRQYSPLKRRDGLDRQDCQKNGPVNGAKKKIRAEEKREGTKDMGAVPLPEQGRKSGVVKKMGVHRITKRSSKKKEEDAKVKAIKIKLIDRYGESCMSCGKHGPVDPSHVIPRSLEPSLITVEENIFLQGDKFLCDCHASWEHKVIDKVALFLNLGDILRRLKILDNSRFTRIVEKLRGAESLPEKIVGLLNGEHED
jgi:hypothetical protein